MADPAESVVAAVTGTANAIDTLGDPRPVPFREREMQAIFVRALDSAIAQAPRPRVVKENHSVTLEAWPGLGPVDVAIVDDRGPVAFIELKWGAGTLYNCVWDLEKLGVAVALGTSRHGYLVAGAPASDWASALGRELFTADEWLTADLLTRYEAHWRFWRTQVKTSPVRLPEVLRTRQIATASLSDGFELRCVEVLVPTKTWIDVQEATEALARFKERLTWKPGDLEFLTPAEAADALGFEPPNPRQED